MKKVIAVAAGLMLTGVMVTTASAAVSFSGDARIRGYYEKDYDLGRTSAVTVVDPVRPLIGINVMVRLPSTPANAMLASGKIV